MRERIAARFYRTSDRTHVTRIRWRKKERIEWRESAVDSAQRFYGYLEKGDLTSAYSALITLYDLREFAWTTYLDASRAFLARVQLKP
jgi:hypothetical protein